MPATLDRAQAASLLADCTPGELERIDLAVKDRERIARIERGRADKEWFARYYFPGRFGDATPDFHRELDALVAQAETDRALPGTIIAAPRGSAKTTRLAFLHVIWSLLYRRHRFIVVASKTQSQAEERVQEIRFELETNDRLREDFGELCGVNYRPSQTWQQNDIVLCWPKRDAHGQVLRDRAKHPLVGYTARLYGVGTGVAVRGLTKPKRPDLILCDDLENDDHVATALQRAKTWSWFSKVIIPMPDPKTGTFVVVGTILHYDSLLSRLLAQRDENERQVYRTHVYRAVEDGRYLWPERLSPEYLANVKQRMGTHAYNQEYLNQPLNSDTQVFRPEWFHWYTKTEVEYDSSQDSWFYRTGPMERAPLRIFAACDPALGGDDEFATIVIGVTPDNRILVLDFWAGHLDFPAQVKRLKGLCEDWLPDALGVEVNAYQQALADQLRGQILVPIRRIKHNRGQGKDAVVGRITAMSPYVENGQFYLRSALDGEPGMLDPAGMAGVRVHMTQFGLFQQMTEYPASAHDDRCDVAELCIQTAKIRRWFEDTPKGA